MPRPLVAALAVAAVLAAGCSTAAPQADLSLGGPLVTTTTTPIDPAVVDLMEGAGMTPSARRLFVAALPALEDKATLAQSCAGLDTSASGSAHTFGCLVRGKVHIRLFAAPELHDMIYVVAAHELLHVVYAQLGVADRVRLGAELALARSDNAVLTDRLRVYSASADDTPNEVHSVLGTEFGSLSPDLTAHFALYIDRARVLPAFRSTLGDREAGIRRLESAAEEMKTRLDTMSAEMEALRAAGDLRTFNARAPVYNALVRQYNSAVDELKSRVAEHKQLVSS